MKTQMYLKSRILLVFAVVAMSAALGVGLLMGTKASTPTLKGDINQDGIVNIYDLGILISHLSSYDANSDLNNDTVINIYDVGILLGNYGKTINSSLATGAVAAGITSQPSTDRTPANIYYIAPHGTATTGCTTSNPCGRIEDALKMVTSGDDQIYLMDGTYTGDDGCYQSTVDCVKVNNVPTGAFAQVTPNASYPDITYPGERITNGTVSTNLTNLGKPIIIRPAPGASVVFERDLTIVMPYLHFDGIHFHNASITVNGASAHAYFSNITMDGAHIVRFMTVTANDFQLWNSTITGNVNGSGVSFGATGSTGQLNGAWVHDNVIGHNICTDCSTFHTDGVHTWGYRNVTIERNLIYDAQAITMFVEGIYADSDNILVQNNVIQASTATNAAALQIVPNHANGQTATIGHVTVRSNTIDGLANIGASGGAPPEGQIDLIGNIIKSIWPTTNPCTNTGWDLSWVRYNVIQNSLCSMLPASNVHGTPVYVDSANQDLRLQPGSPGINLGVVDATSVDKSGKARDTLPDAGAFEQ